MALFCKGDFMKRRKKVIGGITFILLVAIGVLMTVTLNKRVLNSKEIAFVIQRDHCFYLNSDNLNEKYEVEYSFVSNQKDSIIFLEEGIVKSYLNLGDEELHCNISAEKNQKILETTIDGETYYIKPMVVTINPSITPGAYNNCKLFIKYENGAYVKMDIGNISVERDENKNKQELETMMISSYGELGNDYDTFGVVWGVKANQDVEIIDISSQSNTYIPSLADTIVLDEKCKNFNLPDVIGKYPKAKIEHISSVNKTIKVSKNEEKIVVIPLMSERKYILGYYSATVKYKTSNGNISEEVINFTQTMNMLVLTKDLIKKMKDEADEGTVINK